MIWVGWVAHDDSVVPDTQLAFGCTQIRRQVPDPERTETEDSCSNGVDGMEVG
jgi:hypothetical protein